MLALPSVELVNLGRSSREYPRIDPRPNPLLLGTGSTLPPQSFSQSFLCLPYCSSGTVPYRPYRALSGHGKMLTRNGIGETNLRDGYGKNAGRYHISGLRRVERVL